MSTHIKRILVSATLVSGLLALQGCNAWKGLGKDVEDTGKSIQGDKSSDQSNTESDPEEDQDG